jgi:hypothetical protein
MAAKTKPAECPCYDGWICEEHPSQPWGMMAAELRESFVKILIATKTRILFFYAFTAGYSQEEENRQLGKLHSTPRRKK